MKRFASLTATPALAGALLCIGSASQAQNVLNMYLVPISPLSASYAPGDVITFNALVDIPDNNLKPIVLTLAPAVAYDKSIFAINGLSAVADSSAYPPVPAVKLWNLVAPVLRSKTNTGPNGVPLDTFSLGVSHTRQYIQPGNQITSIPGGTYTICTYSFPVISAIDTAHPATIYLPTAYGFGGPYGSAGDLIGNTDANGTMDAILAFPNGGGKFSALTYGTAAVPEPSALLAMAVGTIAAGGTLRRRRAGKFLSRG